MSQAWTADQLSVIYRLVARNLGGETQPVPCPIDKTPLTVAPSYYWSRTEQPLVDVACPQCQRHYSFEAVQPEVA
jgi:hypothetical protein